MVIRVYCGTELDRYKWEWDQFIELIQTIKIEYEEKEEIIHVIGNVYVEGKWLDAIIIKKEGIVALDLKAYSGEIYGKENGKWYVINSEGEKIKLYKNLFVQLSDQRFRMNKKLRKLGKTSFPNIPFDKLERTNCWGYFQTGSHYDSEQISWEERVWFKVITKHQGTIGSGINICLHNIVIGPIIGTKKTLCLKIPTMKINKCTTSIGHILGFNVATDICVMSSRAFRWE